jgi:hypothetical protein
MLPDSDHCPARCRERQVRLPIAFDVPFQFQSPELRVRSGRRSMVRTAMPEAAVAEHTYPRSGEDDIGSYLPSGGLDRVILAKSQS